MRTSTRMTLAAGWATALGAVPLGAVYDSWRWLWFTWAAVGAVVAAHLLARSLRLPAWLVPVVGAVGLLEYLVVVFAGDRAFLGLLPGMSALRGLREGLASGFADIHDLAAPVPATSGLVLITAGSVGLVTIVVDLVAVAIRRPAAAGLALLALYAVPTAVAFDGVAWPLFVIGACGYLILLMVEGRERLLRWGRPVGAAEESGEQTALPLTGQRIGAAALAAAVIVPLFVPGLTTNALSKLGRTGVGDGTGSGGGALSPFAKLRGQLQQPEPKELFRVQVPDNARDLWYLRVKVLEKYTSSGWVDTSHDALRSLDALLDTPYGQPRNATLDEKRYDVHVAVTGQFGDDAVPTFFAPLQITGLGGEWQYDWQKAMVVAGSSQRGGFEYQVTGVEPRPTLDQLLASPTPNPDDPVMRSALATVPNAVPEVVKRTVAEIIKGKNTPYEQARALNDYFINPANGFTYSVQTSKAGDSRNDLIDFLNNKVGFCEQYAAAMAVMLRVAKIPSRVVLGYTHRRPSGDGPWSIYTSDAHAWVEAYFGQQLGWVPFDPTPLADGRSIDLSWAPHPATPTAAGPSASTSSGSASPGAVRTGPFDPGDVNPGAGGDSQRGLFTPKTAIGSLALLLLLLLMVSPGLGRILVRRRRLAAARAGDAADAARMAWDEVLASAEDLGITIPDTETPRRTANRLARELDLDPPAAAGLRLAALAEERVRYAPVAGVDGDLPTAVRAVRRGLRANLSGRRRWRAAVLPPSTLRATWAAIARRSGEASMRLSRLIESLRITLIPRWLLPRRARG